MEGPYLLDEKNVNEHVASKPGVFSLTRNKDGKDVHYFVGRSQDDLKFQLKGFIPESKGNNPAYEKEIPKFFFEYTTSAQSAYELECHWYHQYVSLSDVHPGKTHPSWICPVCKK